MKIKLVSDLHIDINKDGNFGFRYQDFDVLLIAGDIAGGYEKELKFLTGLSKDITCPIYVIAGNHLGYDYNYDPQRLLLSSLDFGKDTRIIGTKQWSINYLKKNTPDNIHYLDNEYVDLGNYVLFSGTMYSDYKLYPNQDLCIRSGNAWLNDFRYVYIEDKKQKVIRRITPYDYIKYHSLFMRRLRKCIKETEKDIIVMSHFAPSSQSISEKYHKGIDEYLNASYASNMEKFIKNNKRIKFWFHGHMHDSFDYYIDQCRIICEPYGYHINNEQKQSPRKWFGKDIEL